MGISIQAAMESNRIKYLSLSLIILMIISASLFFFNRKEEAPSVDPTLFAVAETEKISSVQLITGRDTVDLAFDGSKWKVNKRWDADLQMIKVLMATVRQMVPHRPVAAAIRDSAVSRLSASGTRVILSEAGMPMMEFIAGGNRQQSESWFLKAGDVQPMIMIIPGYRVNVSGIFQLNADGWRNKRVFDFNWRNFKSLTATYPKEGNQGFRVELKDRYFGIAGMQKVDTTKLNDYLDAVSLLMARRFVEGRAEGEKDILAMIEIHDIANRTYTLELFKPGEKSDDVFGRVGKAEWAAFDPEVVPYLVRRRSYFLPTEGQ